MNNDDSKSSEAAGSEIPMLFPAGHFYSPIVNPDELSARDLWSFRDHTPGIDWNMSGQLALLKKLSEFTLEIDFEVDQPDGQPTAYFYNNNQFPCLDAEFLFTSLRYFQPKQMIEVGSGYSSFVTAEVSARGFLSDFHFTCIEPFPRQFLVNGVSGIDELIVSKVQDVDTSVFGRLDAGDILFVDTSHVAKTGSDVNYLFFEVLPRLKPGVIVHFHDIFLPDEYPRHWVMEQGRNWNEQYVLQAYLLANHSVEILWMSHLMLTRCKDEVAEVFRMTKTFEKGGSFWFRV